MLRLHLGPVVDGVEPGELPGQEEVRVVVLGPHPVSVRRGLRQQAGVRAQVAKRRHLLIKRMLNKYIRTVEINPFPVLMYCTVSYRMYGKL